MKSCMYKSISTGVKTALFKTGLANNDAVNTWLELCVISKDSVGNKCSITTYSLNLSGVLRNNVYTSNIAVINTYDNETDGAINLTGYLDYASNEVTFSITVTQATFTPTSMVAYFALRSCCPGTVVIL